MSTTTTALGTPDPEEQDVNGSNVVPIRPATTPDAVPANTPATGDPYIPPTIVEGEEVTDHGVSVDPPAVAEDRSLTARIQGAVAGGQRPIIAPWLRSRDQFAATAKWAARNAAHTTAFHAVRCPVYAAKVASRSPRGAWRLTVATTQWVRDTENKALRERAATEAVIRGNPELYLRIKHDKPTGRLLAVAAASVALTAGVLVLLGYAPWWAQWLGFGTIVGLLGWLGGNPDRPVVGGRAVVTTKAQKLTSDIVVRALAALGVAEINKAVGKGGSGITFPAPISREGNGWRADVDLPYGVTVSDILSRRAALASGLRRPLGCVWPEPAHDQHAGRMVLFVSDVDMSQAKPKPWPLARTGAADLFKAVPFGTDQRGRPVGVDLMYSNMLIGAMPGAGKTFALRVLLLAAALDPTAELRLFELKGSGDLSTLEPVAYHYASGPDDETIEQTVVSLREVYKDLERRAKTISKLPRAQCPENKVTKELAANRKLGLFPLVVAIDECQELFSHPEFGKEAGELCTAIIKRGRALGVILLLATQRPDKTSLPTAVSANVGVRFCLRVMGQLENDMILGTSMYQNGIRATTFTPKDKGIGYMVGAADEPQIARSAYIDNPTAEKIVLRARALREQAGTLAGHAIGDVSLAEDTARANILDDIAGIYAAGEDRLWSEVVAARLAQQYPDTYQGATPNSIAAALKPYGITPRQVPMRDENGEERNRRGYRLDDIADAILATRRASTERNHAES
ncbi:DNA segregation ATPase FtsK/SpoIIIE, S-DNA-T family [Actinokineospora alba]|uniref:DNA segregation ATPase FtsK/SpoIIIE, S-DNA-T family n=1 Tax=Actinokineospora alba TaxID=504798 RepID=A0A1H0T819_9PSEU|nr:FtsK/SpoIIIE domain-containing protein [Actinokineospora alba]TDP66318.1 S-DNA-T family DNA segregation ATPase FtsK/SpoIIIE [Actinokineospora alba]SDJ21882.1 DNA segregation ATPase FtsK/SpoIIIE, S-DNA-T family [Actinokineospora alba]SDP50203.1 DNA segregation ATPase FtsK/SpoIIIE, S-DNA-T family [Actinokineospora alba]